MSEGRRECIIGGSMGVVVFDRLKGFMLKEPQVFNRETDWNIPPNRNEMGAEC